MVNGNFTLRQQKRKYTTLEGSNVAVGKTVFINIVSYNMAKIESFHRRKLGMTKYDKITALFMDVMNRQLSRK